MAQSASQRVLSPSMNQADAISVADLIELAKDDRHVDMSPSRRIIGLMVLLAVDVRGGIKSYFKQRIRWKHRLRMHAETFRNLEPARANGRTQYNRRRMA